jgi:isoquinoline 1-oxidoreductase alpha subunit
MATYTLQINKKIHTIEADPKMPLLWAIRDVVGLTGTKYGCGVAQCGACTVHLNGNPVRSCSLPVSVAANKEITTIEGLSDDNTHAVQLAWIKEQVPQCGYCQSGQIMAAAALLKKNPTPKDADIDAAMQGHICRCGTYPRIRKAIKTASLLINQKAPVK